MVASTNLGCVWEFPLVANGADVGELHADEDNAADRRVNPARHSMESSDAPNSAEDR